jgi:hypothetical protein
VPDSLEGAFSGSFRGYFQSGLAPDFFCREGAVRWRQGVVGAGLIAPPNPPPPTGFTPTPGTIKYVQRKKKKKRKKSEKKRKKVKKKLDRL